jgi:hypothetical protein
VPVRWPASSSRSGNALLDSQKDQYGVFFHGPQLKKTVEFRENDHWVAESYDDRFVKCKRLK